MGFLTTMEYVAGHCEGKNQARPLKPAITHVNVVEEDQRKISLRN
jgi:hypothetical protein